MRALVVYDTLYGNTEEIAQAIGDGFGPPERVRVMAVSAVRPEDLAGFDLVVVGAPTQRHRASGAMKAFLDALPRRSLHGYRATAFDTRYRMSRWVSGSAAVEIFRSLRHAGAAMLDEPQSFFVVAERPPQGEKRRPERVALEDGEIGRARAWGAALAATLQEKAGIHVA